MSTMSFKFEPGDKIKCKAKYLDLTPIEARVIGAEEEVGQNGERFYKLFWLGAKPDPELQMRLYHAAVIEEFYEKVEEGDER